MSEIELKGIEIKQNVFYFTGEETAKLKNNTIYEIKKIELQQQKRSINDEI